MFRRNRRNVTFRFLLGKKSSRKNSNFPGATTRSVSVRIAETNVESEVTRKCRYPLRTSIGNTRRYKICSRPIGFNAVFSRSVPTRSSYYRNTTRYRHGENMLKHTRCILCFSFFFFHRKGSVHTVDVTSANLFPLTPRVRSIQIHPDPLHSFSPISLLVTYLTPRSVVSASVTGSFARPVRSHTRRVVHDVVLFVR
jgi:hypothetical protein